MAVGLEFREAFCLGEFTPSTLGSSLNRFPYCVWGFTIGPAAVIPKTWAFAKDIDYSPAKDIDYPSTKDIGYPPAKDKLV